MKTILKTTLALALLCSSMISYGSSGTKELLNGLTLTLVKKGHQLIVKDQSGDVLHEETITSDNALKSDFDLTGLSDGLYTLEIAKDFEISTKKFVVTNHEVTFLKNSEEKSFKPVFRLNGKRIFISQLALHPEKELDIEIYFENELISVETVSGNKILNRIYHLKGDVFGTYTVVMRNNNRVYKESFRI